MQNVWPRETHHLGNHRQTPNRHTLLNAAQDWKHCSRPVRLRRDLRSLPERLNLPRTRMWWCHLPMKEKAPTPAALQPSGPQPSAEGAGAHVPGAARLQREELFVAMETETHQRKRRAVDVPETSSGDGARGSMQLGDVESRHQSAA